MNDKLKAYLGIKDPAPAAMPTGKAAKVEPVAMPTGETDRGKRHGPFKAFGFEFWINCPETGDCVILWDEDKDGHIGSQQTWEDFEAGKKSKRIKKAVKAQLDGLRC